MSAASQHEIRPGGIVTREKHTMGETTLVRLSSLILILALAGCTAAPAASPTAEVTAPTEVAEATEAPAPPTDAATPTARPTPAGAVPVILSPPTGSLIIGTTLTLEGTGEPGSTLRLKTGYEESTVDVGADGHWSTTISVRLGRRYHFTAVDVNSGARSSPWVEVLVVNEAEATQRAVTPTAGRFSPQISFVTSPTAEPAGIYTTGTKEIFALVSYDGMEDGMIMRRVWTLNDEPFTEKEEPWNVAKYGASGVRIDISIHDFANGLPEGRYQLFLYIDGQEQTNPSGIGNVFTIRHKPALWDKPLTSPDGTSVLSVEPPGRIVITRGGTSKTLVEADWIYEAAWFPDSTHIAYTNLIGKPDAIWLGIEHNISVVNVVNGTSWPIEFPENDIPLRELQMSPDGKALFVVAGVAYGDAEGGGGPGAMFVILDDALKVSDAVFVNNFSGYPLGEDCTSSYVTQASVYNQPKYQGNWASASTFNLKVQVTCGGQDLSGTYAFNVDTKTATRIGP